MHPLNLTCPGANRSSRRREALRWAAIGGLVAALGCSDRPEPAGGDPDRGLPTTAPDAARDATPDAAMIDPVGALRIDQLQMKGTHNSYHLAPDNPVLPEFDYSHPPLTEQLDRGIRQFELDIYAEVDGYRVYHFPGVDAETTCPTLTACLGEIEAWSAANPWHHVLLIFIEPKVVTADIAERLDGVIYGVWPRDRLLAPDDIRGDHPDLRTALAVDGWPTVAETRGQAMFFLFDTDQPRDDYIADDPRLVGRALFPRVGLGEGPQPFGAFTMGDVVDPERFATQMTHGLLTRTRADDAENRALAIETGVHVLSFDFPERWPGGSRCNPVTAPPDCDSTTIEPR